MRKFTEGNAFKERSNGNIPYAEIISFVSKVEDLMERYGLNIVSDIEDIFLKFKNSQEENQKLKERWSDLRHFIEKDHDDNLARGNNDCALGQRWVLDEMDLIEQMED